MEKVCQMPCQSRLPSPCTKYLSIIYPLVVLPSHAPAPFVIIMNNPWALALMLESVFVSTNRDPEMLKKSKAIPYTIQDKTINSVPATEGSPYAKSPNLNTQAHIAKSMTVFIPNLF